MTEHLKKNTKVTMLNMDVEMEPNVILIVPSMFVFFSRFF